MSDNQNSPATKADLDAAIVRMGALIAEREIVAGRWTLGLLALYFFGTLASVWVLVGEEIKPLREDLAQIKADTRELRTEIQQLTR
jgi:hypothetical protein